MKSNATVSTEQLRVCSRQLAAGVAVVTTCDVDGHPYGLTMSAVVCLSLEPALLLICVGESSETLRPQIESRVSAGSILGRDQEALARTFASKGGTDKFKRVEYRQGVSLRVPVLTDSLAVIECRFVDSYPGGDHRGVIGGVTVACVNGGLPLLHYDGCYLGVEADAASFPHLACRDIVTEPA